MRVMALPSDRPVSELAPLLADWDVPRFVELLRALGTPTPMGTPATAGRCGAARSAGMLCKLLACFHC